MRQFTECGKILRVNNKAKGCIYEKFTSQHIYLKLVSDQKLAFWNAIFHSLHQKMWPRTVKVLNAIKTRLRASKVAKRYKYSLWFSFWLPTKLKKTIQLFEKIFLIHCLSSHILNTFLSEDQESQPSAKKSLCCICLMSKQGNASWECWPAPSQKNVASLLTSYRPGLSSDIWPAWPLSARQDAWPAHRLMHAQWNVGTFPDILDTWPSQVCLVSWTPFILTVLTLHMSNRYATPTTLPPAVKTRFRK